MGASGRRIAAALIVASVAIGGAGCGGSDDVDSETIAKAAKATAARGGMEIDFESAMSIEGVKGLPTTATGVEDPARRIADYRIDFSSYAPVFEQTEGVKAKPADFRGRMIRVGPVLYSSFPFLTNELARKNGLDGTWFEFDLRSSQDARLAQFDTSKQNPGQLFDYVTVATTTERVGEEKVRGIDTTHWRGEFEFDRMAKAVPAEERETVQRGADDLAEATRDDAAPVEAWIDREGLIRRIRVKYGFVQTSGGKEVNSSLDMTEYLSAFGTRVRVRRPRADEVLTLDELLRAANR